VESVIANVPLVLVQNQRNAAVVPQVTIQAVALHALVVQRDALLVLEEATLNVQVALLDIT